MVVGYLSSTYRDAIAFGILILVLLLRPAGDPRARSRRRRCEGLLSPPSRSSRRSSPPTPLFTGRFGAGARDVARISSRSSAWRASTSSSPCSLNLINGFTGQFSIGHAGFMAIGAYASAFITVTFGDRMRAALSFLPACAASDGALLLVAALGGGRAARRDRRVLRRACRRCGCAGTTSPSSRSASARSSASSS